MQFREEIMRYAGELEKLCVKNDSIAPEFYEQYDVKRGLRDINGKGVLTGLTNISRIDSSKIVNGEKVSCDGKLWYRGYDIFDLVKMFAGQGFGFEKTAYLLLFGDLPDESETERFCYVLSKSRTLPTNFVRDVIMKAPSRDIMNSMTRSILTLGSYNKAVVKNDLADEIREDIMLIATFPLLAVYAYHAYNHYTNLGSMYIHRPDPGRSTAENILAMLRPDSKYTKLEADVLDIALILHMEHGGGNNSTFTTRVVTSSGSDAYSSVAAAMCSLKGPRHGGANIKVTEMMADIHKNVKDPDDKDALKAYLLKILEKEAFDRQGLIYGMGHAVYSLSDPRERVLKEYARKLAYETGKEKKFDFYESVELAAPEVIAEHRHIYKGVSPNVDFYSGLVYEILGIPKELYTPLFAIARIAGWSAHRLEELIGGGKIIRPAYQSVMEVKENRP